MNTFVLLPSYTNNKIIISDKINQKYNALNNINYEAKEEKVHSVLLKLLKCLFEEEQSNDNTKDSESKQDQKRKLFVHDTKNNNYLDGYKPDFTISLEKNFVNSKDERKGNNMI